MHVCTLAFSLLLFSHLRPVCLGRRLYVSAIETQYFACMYAGLDWGFERRSLRGWKWDPSHTYRTPLLSQLLIHIPYRSGA
ncbi:uncharacterized protein BO66DRAFT_394854 [Aspergillus aculeatinus CBS 121060]|uniref:Uncharacterized protein n=1 Tax=Aspergillus aculeatinus CBS 121060 TaxID=1448322 RepID=A0ACD1GXU5_9EURO|nr:hypothetical protein BO66DRAFT_394854 [Aspergillus aculeatinus CBS 121060]RAH66159.1 hypothetical protein BO66DRAFT_394854 [Aspergillus aculeatinus CBS 121060]